MRATVSPSRGRGERYEGTRASKEVMMADASGDEGHAHVVDARRRDADARAVGEREALRGLLVLRRSRHVHRGASTGAAAAADLARLDEDAVARRLARGVIARHVDLDA